MPPFRVDYYCPRQSSHWQLGKNNVMNFYIACGWAEALKPGSPDGRARVVDSQGQVVFEI